ncbi:hypothetical protein A1O7_09803 [Cladophialophora yegresii CBS 114405]|uniref:GAF domain-containing protein n=1 Tax=Cladophialophora yegresii CBS 114405 TaxID=1182544 RepID=W9VG64_9EURO|nr:uncharacterized protein A1O7_09803 [Cladophialophora yegresii CBS 114405]EXJ54463.1 hypothetical protein A1O7_09803 [Cladophialophora yegresii CBS 114405]
MPHAEHSNFAKPGAQTTKPAAYQQALASLASLCEGQRNWVCNLANAASLLWHLHHSLPPPREREAATQPGSGIGVNWAGFYVLDPSAPEKQLILGPFMGKVACQTIALGKGVCGTAAVGRDGSGRGETLLVSDVDAFPGHIACDGESRSEIVVPIRATNGKVVGVIDIDCAELDGFDEEDQKGLEAIADLLGQACDW